MKISKVGGIVAILLLGLFLIREAQLWYFWWELSPEDKRSVIIHYQLQSLRANGQGHPLNPLGETIYSFGKALINVGFPISIVGKMIARSVDGLYQTAWVLDLPTFVPLTDTLTKTMAGEGTSGAFWRTVSAISTTALVLFALTSRLGIAILLGLFTLSVLIDKLAGTYTNIEGILAIPIIVFLAFVRMRKARRNAVAMVST